MRMDIQRAIGLMFDIGMELTSVYSPANLPANGNPIQSEQFFQLKLSGVGSGRTRVPLWLGWDS